MRNDLVMPSLIIAAAIIISAVLYRVLPSARNDASRPFPGGPTAGVSGSSFAVPDSGSASLVTAVDGHRLRVSLLPRKTRKQTEIDVVIVANTSVSAKDGSPLSDRELKRGDLIEFTPDVFPGDATEVVAETVTLIFRPPVNR